jgi:hypothetical protein
MSISHPTKPSFRWKLWIPLLIISAWLAWDAQSNDQPSEIVKATVSVKQNSNVENVNSNNSGNSINSPISSATQVIKRSDLYPIAQASLVSKDLFNSIDWSPPPPPPPPVTPQKPTAPNLPFTVVGQQLKEDKLEIFLSRGEQTLIVKKGDIVQEQYRVDMVTNQSITFTYLPLGIQQSLSISDSK